MYGKLNRLSMKCVILHSTEGDKLSPFDSKIACLCQSIEINISPEPGAKANWQWGRVGWMLAHHRDGLSSSSLLAWSSIAQSVCQRAFSLLAIRCQRPWVDNLSPFDSLPCARASKLTTTKMCKTCWYSQILVKNCTWWKITLCHKVLYECLGGGGNKWWKVVGKLSESYVGAKRVWGGIAATRGWRPWFFFLTYLNRDHWTFSVKTGVNACRCKAELGSIEVIKKIGCLVNTLKW